MINGDVVFVWALKTTRWLLLGRQTLIRGSINILVGSLLSRWEDTATHYHSAAIVELAVKNHNRKWSHDEVDNGKGTRPAIWKESNTD